MLHFYAECPYGLDEQEIRLGAARVLVNVGIRYLVHFEDALAFIHFVPTVLFGLHFVVADQDADRAANAITNALPYHVHTGVVEQYCESILRDPAQTRMYTTSTYLWRSVPPVNGESMLLFVHPQTRFNIDVGDYTRSVPLPPFPDSIRFPTLAAFLDSIIEDHLNPSQAGYISGRESDRFSVYMSYVCLYNLRHEGPAVLPNGDLYPNCAEVVQSLRPENRSLFEDYARLSRRKGDIEYHVKNHKAILRNQGYVQLLFFFR